MTCDRVEHKDSPKSSAPPVGSTAKDLAIELLPEITSITNQLFDLGYDGDDEVGQRVNAIRHKLICLKYDA